MDYAGKTIRNFYFLFLAYSLCQHIRQITRQSAHIKTCYLHSSGLSISGVIQISPSISLFDQNILVKLQSLPRNAKVTLFARVEQDWRRSPAVFASCSHHVTSDSGCVDLEKDASMGGTYTGKCCLLSVSVYIMA